MVEFLIVCGLAVAMSIVGLAVLTRLLAATKTLSVEATEVAPTSRTIAWVNLHRVVVAACTAATASTAAAAYDVRHNEPSTPRLQIAGEAQTAANATRIAYPEEVGN